MPMISSLDLTGAIAAALATLFLITHWRRRLATEEKWIVLLVCALTVLINGISVWSWSGQHFAGQVAENWGDYLQILQPALWGMFFYVVVQSALRNELKASRQRMRDLVENMPVILNAYDRDGRILAWNRTAQEVTGFSRDDVVGNSQALQQLFPDSQVQEQLRMECEHGGGHYKHRIYTLKGRKDERQIAWYNIAQEFPISGWANWSIGLDMTEQLAAQRQLEHLATHDELTGLANRALLHDRLHHALAASQRNDTTGALLMLDLDHYKMVNDSHGHPVGDQLLREVGKRLSRCLKSTDTLARIGGDEFMVLLDYIHDPEEAAIVAQRLLSALGEAPFLLFGTSIRTRASIGVTIFPDDDIRLDELMKNVDLALYTAKQNGRNNFHFYSRNLHTQFRWQHQVAEKLRDAISSDGLLLHYQPQIALRDHRVAGVEALLRWPGFENGSLSPAIFVPIAENNGLMPDLGRWVVENAFRQAATWQAQHGPMTTAVNLSAVQLYQPNLADFLLQLLERLQLNAENIDLEITESAVMRNVDDAITAMKQLRDKGFHISLDDFGTGYSSLSYLKRFPVSRIKIDQSFVQGMDTSAGDIAIVRNVIRLGHDLGLLVLAEGVETREQLQRLGDEGCDLVQGFFCSKPLAAGPLGEFLRQGGGLVH